MGMPDNLVLVRHGESEGNVATTLSKAGDNSWYTDAFTTTPGHQWRLTAKGRQQARMSGEWITRHVTAAFDGFYVSPYVRTRETAGNLDLPGARWRLNRALRERDWGDIGSLTKTEFNSSDMFALSKLTRDIDPLYWVPPGGESIGQVAEDRVRNVLDTLHREQAGKDVICVTHGEAMWAFRLVLERLDDDQFVTLDNDKSERIHNCEVIHYTRINPFATDEQRRRVTKQTHGWAARHPHLGRLLYGTPDPQVYARRLAWMRRARPVVDDAGRESMVVGDWVAIDFTTRSNADLLESVARVPSLDPTLESAPDPTPAGGALAS